MDYLRKMTSKYRVGAIAFDPRFLDYPAKVLYDEGLPMREVAQSVERMTSICGDLYTSVRQGKVTHDADPQFREQVLNAIVRPNQSGFTLSKGKSRGHIDAAVALGLAAVMAHQKEKRHYPVAVF
jgi:phage terminase large subunit-like protein